MHGVPDLEGASEIAPGLRIYTGGEEAAIDAVFDGRCSPLDFRWFVGRTEGVSTVEGSWLAVACARPVALKQCLGLPKPLWHEVTLSLPTVSPYICHAPFFRMHHPHSFLCTTRIVLSMLTTRRSWSSVAASPQRSASSSYSSGRSELLGCRLRLYLFLRAYVYSYTDYTAMDALRGARSRALISDSKTVCCRSCIPHCACSCFKIKSVYICDSPYSDSNGMTHL